ncbi:hypothetical protein IKP13_04485 [bacterium]|nr:hypothetical protein [bacterium]
MKEYLEKILHQTVDLSDFEELNRLPLIYRGSFRFYMAETNNLKFLIAVPVDETNLSILRRQQKQIEFYSGFYCALYLKKMNCYSRDRMLEEGIPFIWEDHQIYLPFLGVMLNQTGNRELKPCTEISFLTQKLLITALYQNWSGITVTEAAKRLDVAKISVTRCFDELEILDIPLLQLKNRARKFSIEKSRKKTWKTIRPFMKNPIIRTFRLAERIEKPLIKSGVSALASYSMLEDNTYPTYAVLKPELSKSGILNKKQISLSESPECVVHEIGYHIPQIKKDAVDPLSLTLMLSSEEKSDPRIAKTIEEMLEEYVW